MNKQIDNWIKALKSRKYHQGSILLRNKWDQYSAFGVLLDIIDPDSWKFNEEYPCWEWRSEKFDIPTLILEEFTALKSVDPFIREKHNRIITRKKYQLKKTDTCNLYNAIDNLNYHHIRFPVIAAYMEEVLNEVL